MDSNASASTSSGRRKTKRYEDRPPPSGSTPTIPSSMINSFPSASQTLGSAAISSETTMPSASTSGALPGRGDSVQPLTVSASSNLHTRSISTLSVPVIGPPHRSRTTRQTDRLSQQRLNGGHRISSSNPTLPHPNMPNTALEALLFHPIPDPIPRPSRPNPHQTAPSVSPTPPLTYTSSTSPWHERLRQVDGNWNRQSILMPSPRPSSILTYTSQYNHASDTLGLPSQIRSNQAHALVQRRYSQLATHRSSPYPIPPPQQASRDGNHQRQPFPVIQRQQYQTSFATQMPPYLTHNPQNSSWYIQEPNSLLLAGPDSYAPQPYTLQYPQDQVLGGASVHTTGHSGIRHGQGVGIVATSSSLISPDEWAGLLNQENNRGRTLDDSNTESR